MIKCWKRFLMRSQPTKPITEVPRFFNQSNLQLVWTRKSIRRESFYSLMEVYLDPKMWSSILVTPARKKMMTQEYLLLELEMDATSILSRNQQKRERENITSSWSMRWTNLSLRLSTHFNSPLSHLLLDVHSPLELKSKPLCSIHQEFVLKEQCLETSFLDISQLSQSQPLTLFSASLTACMIQRPKAPPIKNSPAQSFSQLKETHYSSLRQRKRWPTHQILSSCLPNTRFWVIRQALSGLWSKKKRATLRWSLSPNQRLSQKYKSRTTLLLITVPLEALLWVILQWAVVWLLHKWWWLPLKVKAMAWLPLKVKAMAWLPHKVKAMVWLLHKCLCRIN